MKRAFDLVVASVLLGALLGPMLLLAVVIWVRMGRPILFRQVRTGWHGRPFELIKFRTMRPGTGNQPDAERLTLLGRVLRATSLDELPQLFNVARGEMSLVGPRPLLTQYLPLYTEEQARRHRVRPGITGWAQINGRNALSWEQKFALDVWYVENRSFWLDLQILWTTLTKVVRREGISQDGHATMEVFRGNR